MTAMPLLRSVLTTTAFGVASAWAHDTGGDPHPHYDFPVKPPGVVLAQAVASENRGRGGDRTAPSKQPAQATVFGAFAPKVTLRWDERFLFVESNGLPAHPMMVGITAWQQQVPLPQSYTGANAWQIPLTPVPAKEPASIKNRFLRGAIALAANGIPIFNPQNNRGEISQDIGELDEWGGHCGRADDYHYHAAPLHLQSVLGPQLPIAYALDGYPIYGLTEPDGSAPAALDSFNGHSTAALGYHYHASKTYPFVNGGFHGEVVERDGQVDPQPRANPVRDALPPLRGAKITGFEAATANAYKLSYEVNGEKRAVTYALDADGSFGFEFQNGREGTVKETYTPRPRGAGERGGPRRDKEGGGPPPRPRGEGAPPREGRDPDRRRDEPRPDAAMNTLKKPLPTFILTSPEIGADRKLPAEFTGDGRGVTPPLAWSGAPLGTQSFAVVMDHLAPGNDIKTYWTMWDIPPTTSALPKAVSGLGQFGPSFKGSIGYEPPHSQGRGAKTYVLTVYALSAALKLDRPAGEVNRETLLAAMQDKVLASASLEVVYARDERPRTPAESSTPPARPVSAR